MKKYLTSGVVIYSFLLASLFILSIFRITDNDVWWHLKTGGLIFNTHSIPRADVFSYTIFGKPWLAFEWLAQVLLYIVYKIGGLSALTLFKAFVVALIFSHTVRSHRSRDHFLAAVIIGLGFLIMRDGLRERPQLFTYFFVAAYTFALRTKKRPLFLIPMMQVAWANMHGPASLIGIGIVGLYTIFDDALHAERKIALFLGTAAAFFITPHAYKNAEYIYVFFRDGFNKLILEYRPPVFSGTYAPYFLFLGLAAAAAVWRLYRFFGSGGRETDHFRDALIIIFGAAGSLAAIRNIPVFALLAAPIVIETISDIFPRFSITELAEKNKVSAALCGVLLALFLYGGARALDPAGKYAFGIGDAHKARHAADFLIGNGIKGPVFNDYDFGGYMIWRLYPTEKVFVDGRLVEYGASFVERSFYFWKPEVWDDLEKEYKFNAAVIAQENYYSCKYLDDRPDWTLVYWDDGALVYLKDNKLNSPLIRKYGYECLRPNFWMSPEYLTRFPYKKVKAEAERSFAAAPYSVKAGLLSEWVMQQVTVDRKK